MTTNTGLTLLPTLLFTLGSPLLAAEPSPQPAASRPVDEAAMCTRSLVNPGDTARLQRVLAKARRGEAVTVGVIGGSITQGASASKGERRYGDLMAAWWRQQFPKAMIKYINAGIGATGSNYGAMRVRRDLLEQQPDFIVVEYAVNDGNTREYAESLEGLLRQMLKAPGQPAVLLFFTMRQDGGNAQE